MRLLILAVFCYGVDGNQYQNYDSTVLRPGFRYTCGLSPVEKAIGSLKETGRQTFSNRAQKFGRENGNALIDNEAYVRNKDNYVYPCDRKDYACIRQFFEDNCECERTYGPVADPFCVAKNTVFLASVNVSVIYTDVEFGGLSNTTTYTFFYNKKTRFLVFSIKVPVLTVKTRNICFEYHKPGEESIIKCDCATITFKSLIFTAEFPGIPNCRLDLADIHGYTDDAYPEFFIGPNVSESTDPTVIKAYATLLKNVPIVVKENLLFQSELVMAQYIQSIICNFDLKICSV